MSKITDVLGKLDPANDNHWTADGLPRIETVRMLAADQTITREDITMEAPAFTRKALEAMALTPPAAPVPPAAVAPPVAPVPQTQAAETAKDNETVVQDEQAPIDYDAQIAMAQDELHQALIARDLAQEVVNDKQNDLDELISAKHAYDPSDSNATVIQSYLKSQGEALTERGRRATVLRESGVTLADIKNLIPQASPLDRAIASKKK